MEVEGERNYMTKQANRAFFSTWTPDMAYVFGFWFADGWMSQPNSDPFVAIVSKDLEHLRRIRQVMGAEQKIYARKDGCQQLTIGSKQMWHDLRRLGGVPAKSWAAEMPFVPPLLLRHFTRGYVDGDGWLYWDTSQRPSPKIGMAGRPLFLAKLADALNEETGIGIPVIEAYGGETPRIYYGGIRAKVLAKWLYENSDLALERKAAIARAFAAWELSKYGWKSRTVMTSKMRRILEM